MSSVSSADVEGNMSFQGSLSSPSSTSTPDRQKIRVGSTPSPREWSTPVDFEDFCKSLDPIIKEALIQNKVNFGYLAILPVIE